MNHQTRKIVQALFLIGFCMLLFLQNYASVSWDGNGKEEVLTETTGETESESNKKISENELELEDFNSFLSHLIVPVSSSFMPIVVPSICLPSSLSDGIEFPPEF